MYYNTKVFNTLFDFVNKELENKVDFKVNLFKTPPKNSEYPLVLMQQINNSIVANTTYNIETISNITLEIDIYTQDMTIDNELIDKYDINNHTFEIIDNYLINKGLKRINCTPTPILDRNLYRFTAKYTFKVNNNRNIICNK